MDTATATRIPTPTTACTFSAPAAEGSGSRLVRAVTTALMVAAFVLACWFGAPSDDATSIANVDLDAHSEIAPDSALLADSSPLGE